MMALDKESLLSSLEAQGRALASKHLEISQTAAILRPLIEDESIHKSIDNTYAAHAHEHLIFTLLYSVIQSLCNLTLDRDRRSLSLRNVLDEINDDAVKPLIREKFSRPIPIKLIGNSLDQLSDQERTAYLERREREDRAKEAERFDELLNKVNERAQELFDGELAGKLNRARNKVISHYDKAPVGQEAPLVSISEMGLKWGDHERFLSESRSVIFDTVLLVTRGNYELEGFAEMHTKYAEDFWNHWKKGWSG